MFRRSLVFLLLSWPVAGGTVLAQEVMPAPRREADGRLVPVSGNAPPPLIGHPHPIPRADACYKTTRFELVEEQKLIAKPTLGLREEIIALPTLGYKIEYREEKQTVVIMVRKPREEEHLVTSMVCVSEEALDPCTGCPKTIQKQIPVTRVARVTVYDMVPETREAVVRVPVCKPEEITVRLKRLVLEETTAPTILRKLRLQETPLDIKYQVPVSPPPSLHAAPPPPPCNCSTPPLHP